jgi:hypothetical protein
MPPTQVDMPASRASRTVSTRVGPGVGRHDLIVVALAGLEVVVEAIDAGGPQARGLGLGQEAERRAQLDRRLGLDALGGFADHVEVALRRAAGRGDHAVAAGLGGDRAPRAFDQLVDRLHRRLAAGRAVARRLRAEPAVLGTGAGLGVVEDVEQDPLAPVVAPDLVGGVEQRQEVGGRRAQHRGGVGAIDRRAGQGAVGEGVPARAGLDHRRGHYTSRAGRGPYRTLPLRAAGQRGRSARGDPGLDREAALELVLGRVQAAGEQELLAARQDLVDRQRHLDHHRGAGLDGAAQGDLAAHRGQVDPVRRRREGVLQAVELEGPGRRVGDLDEQDHVGRGLAGGLLDREDLELGALRPAATEGAGAQGEGGPKREGGHAGVGDQAGEEHGGRGWSMRDLCRSRNKSKPLLCRHLASRFDAARQPAFTIERGAGVALSAGRDPPPARSCTVGA